MIWVAKRVLLVKEIEEAGDGFGESSDQKSAAFYVAALLKSRPDVGEVHQADKGGKNTRRTSW